MCASDSHGGCLSWSRTLLVYSSEVIRPMENPSLKKISINKVKAVSNKKIKVEWKKLNSKDRKKINQIEIQVSTNKHFTKIVKSKKVKSSKTSYTVSGLKKNTKYYVRIRAYTKSGNTIYVSKWSSKKSITTKK